MQLHITKNWITSYVFRCINSINGIKMLLMTLTCEVETLDLHVGVGGVLLPDGPWGSTIERGGGVPPGLALPAAHTPLTCRTINTWLIEIIIICMYTLFSASVASTSWNEGDLHAGIKILLYMVNNKSSNNVYSVGFIESPNNKQIWLTSKLCKLFANCSLRTYEIMRVPAVEFTFLKTGIWTVPSSETYKCLAERIYQKENKCHRTLLSIFHSSWFIWKRKHTCKQHTPTTDGMVAAEEAGRWSVDSQYNGVHVGRHCHRLPYPSTR